MSPSTCPLSWLPSLLLLGRNTDTSCLYEAFIQTLGSRADRRGPGGPPTHFSQVLLVCRAGRQRSGLRTLNEALPLGLASPHPHTPCNVPGSEVGQTVAAWGEAGGTVGGGGVRCWRGLLRGLRHCYLFFSSSRTDWCGQKKPRVPPRQRCLSRPLLERTPQAPHLWCNRGSESRFPTSCPSC